MHEVIQAVYAVGGTKLAPILREARRRSIQPVPRPAIQLVIQPVQQVNQPVWMQCEGRNYRQFEGSRAAIDSAPAIQPVIQRVQQVIQTVYAVGGPRLSPILREARLSSIQAVPRPAIQLGLQTIQQNIHTVFTHVDLGD